MLNNSSNSNNSGARSLLLGRQLDPPLQEVLQLRPLLSDMYRYICMCVYLYIYIYICLCIYIYIYIHTYIDMCVYIYI